MWKVVPIQGRQLLDVRQEDLFGDFRLCETYRGGGGYDMFPKICKKRNLLPNLDESELSKQFVVQLYGCPLDCHYCYVTHSGVFGKVKHHSTESLIKAFEASGTNVFHLMGGAPALYLEHWSDIVDRLPTNTIFHSDLMLIEKEYDINWLLRLRRDNVLLAVNIKGVTSEDFYKNTQRRLNWNLLKNNLAKLIVADVNFYITFTNPDKTNLSKFMLEMSLEFGDSIFEDSYIIDLVIYEAIKHKEIVI